MQAALFKQKNGIFAQFYASFFEEISFKKMDFTIRAATKADLPVIRQLAHQIWPVAYSEILSPKQLDYMLRLFYTEESLARQIEEGQQFFLLKTNEKPVGFAAVGPTDANRWKLHKLYVLPEWQGRQLGAMLLSHAEAFARANSGNILFLQVNRHNRAQDFYLRNGFQITAEKDFDIGEGFFMNDFVMEKKL